MGSFIGLTSPWFDANNTRFMDTSLLHMFIGDIHHFYMGCLECSGCLVVKKSLKICCYYLATADSL